MILLTLKLTGAYRGYVSDILRMTGKIDRDGDRFAVN
jgi:hypothetical protein